MKTYPLLLLLGAGLLAGDGLQAQTSAPPAAVTAAAAPPTNAVAATPAPAALPPAPRPSAPAPDKSIRFQFDGIPYTDVVERFAQMAGKPLLTDTNLAGTLTYDDPRSYNYVEALDTLNLILGMKGAMLIEDGNNLRLVPFKQLPSMPLRIMRGLESTGDIRPAEVVTVVLDTSNLDSKEVADSVLPMLSPAGSVASLGKGRGLIITDRLANIQRVRTLLTTIATEQPANRSMKTYTLVHASGAIIADLLNRTFGLATAPKRTSYNPNSKAMEVLPPDPNDYITAVYDEASRTLVLFGPPDRISLAEELINKFEQKDGVTGDVRIYYPQSIKAEELANLIRQAIPGVAQPNEPVSSSSTKARVIADAAQNRVIVAAPIPSQLDQIEQLVTRVDKGVVGAVGRAAEPAPLKSETIQLTKVFRPRATEATNAATIIKQAVTRRNAQGLNVTTASVTCDPGSQSVVVTGSPQDVQMASDILTQLETGSSQPTPLVTRFLEVGSPEEAKRIQPLLEQLYKNQTSDGASGGLPHAKILAEPESGRLIITASEEHQLRLAELAKQLRSDRPQGITRHLKVISLKNTRTDTALPAIQSLVTDRMADRRFATLPKPALVADAPNNRLLVTATDDQLAEIEEVVKIVDVAPVQTQRQMTVIPLQARQASEILPMVTQLVNQLATPGELAPTLMADPTGKQVIVLAAAKDQERIRTLLQQFDVTAATAAPRQFRGVELFSRTATEFTPLVQQLYQEQIRGQPEPAGGPATLLPDTKNNRIMVSGSEKEIARVEAIIRQLDPTRTSPTKSETRVVRLKTGSATELAGLVDKSLNAQSQQVKVLVDAHSNSLVVTGDSSAVDAAAQLIQQLDTRVDAGPREMRLLELKTADAATLAPMVNNLFTELLKDQHGPDYVSTTRIVADATANRLIVSGPREELTQVTSLVAKLDNAPEQAAGARVFRLNMSEASAMCSVVSNAMLKFDPRGHPIPRVTVTADEKSNSLIISGPRADLQDAEAVIQRLDGETTLKEKVLRVFEVKGDADALSALVQKVFAAQNPGRNPSSLPTITPQPSGKRLFVLAAPAMMSQIETIITSLDENPNEGQRELHAVALTNAVANDLLPKVKQIYEEQARDKTLKPATLYTDASGERLLVQGTAEQAATIQQIVETLQCPARPARETKVFEIGSSADVQRILPLAQQLYKDQWQGKQESDPADAQFVADPKTGRLIISGKPEHLKQIETILQQLGAGKSQAESRSTRILDLTTASAVELSTTVRTLYLEEAKGRLGNQVPDTLITPDAGGNRLIVVGETNELNAVEEVVRKLDKVSAQSASARVFKIKSADPAKVAEILTASLVRYDAYGRPQKRSAVSVDAKTRTIIVTGDPKELQGVSAIIEQLDQSLGDQPERKMKVVTLKQGRVATIAAQARQVFNDRIKSQPDLGTSDVLLLEEPTSNQLILAGNEAQLQIIDQILEELQAAQTARAARETKLLEAGTPDEMNRLLPLVQQLYRDRMMGRDASDRPDAQIIPDEKNGRFIVTGRTNHIAEIEGILAQLRTGQTSCDARETRIFELTTATAADLSSTVRTLYQEQAKTRPGIAAADTLILPDSGANRIIVTGSTNELQIVEDIIKKLDKVSAQSASARVFKIKSADPAKVAEILTASLVRYDAYGRPQKRSTVSVDAKTRTLIVTGDPKELQAVSVIIEQLDQSLGDQPERTMKVVTLKQGRVATIASQARQIFNDRIKSQPDLGTSDVLILEEAASNQLILAGNEAQLKIIDEILEQLVTAQTARSARETKLLEAGTPEEMNRLLPLVQQLYRDRMGGKDASDPPDAQIIADEKNGRYIVTGRTNHIAEIEGILAQLRTGQTNCDARETRVFELTTATAADLSSTVRTLYQEQAKTRPGIAAADTLILPDSGANRLIVTGATNEIAIVEDIIKKLDKVSAQSASARVFKIKSADPDKVAEILGTSLVRYDSYGRPQKRVSVVTDAKTRTIIATGDPKELQSAAVIIDQLDASLGEQPARVMRVLAVKDRSVSELSTKVRQVYQDRAREDAELGTTEPLILEDATSNQIILAGTEKQLAAIDEIAQTLQKSGPACERQVKTYTLERSSASSIVAMLSQVYAKQIRSTEPSERVVVSAGGNDRSLVVEAPATTLSRIDELVRGLEQPGPEGANVIQTVRLNKSRADELAESLNRAMTNRSAAFLGRRVTVTAVPGANSLLINGPTNAVQDVMKMIHDLDQEGTDPGDIEIRVYKLENGTAREVSALLESLLQSVTRNLPGYSRNGNSSGRPREANLSVDERSNSLIISGTAAHFKVVEKILPTLDKAPERSDRDVQFVWLRKAKATEVSSRLEDLFADRPRSERPVIEPDTAGNSLTIIAKRGDIAQIQDLVARLDAQGKTSSVQVRVRPLDHMAAEQLADMLKNIYPQVSGTPVRVSDKVPAPPPSSPLAPRLSGPAPSPSSPSSNAPPSAPDGLPPDTQPSPAPEVVIAVDKTANALILSGPAQELDNVDRLIADLAQNFYGNESEFRLFSIKDADPIIVARTLTELLRQEAVVAPQRPGEPPQRVAVQQHITVVAEPRTRSVIVRARPTDFALMESLIKQLDKAGEMAQLEFRVVPLTNAPPEKVLPLVQQMVTQLNATRPGETVTVGLDTLSRGILVVGRELMRDQVEKMIRTLDKPAENAEAEVRIISLKKANAQQLAQVLRNMLRPGVRGEASPAARDLQEQVSRLKIAAEDGHTVLLDLTKPIKIDTDPASGGQGGGNRLVLTSTPDNLCALAAVVELMDSVPVLDGVEIRFVKLHHAEASVVSQTLTTIFSQGKTLAAGPGGPGGVPAGQGQALVSPLNVAIDARGNTVILSGRPESLELALKVIHDMDSEVGGYVTEVRLFRLKYASATRLLPLLQAVFAEGPPVGGAQGLAAQVSRLQVIKNGRPANANETPKPRAALTIQADDSSNTLIVAAREDNLPLIQDVIEELDIPAASGLETVRIYPLEHADPAAVQKVLTDLYNSPRAATMRAEDKPIISIDGRTGALIVAGNSKAFGIIEALLKQLDQKLPFDLRDLALIPLAHADANVVAPTLQKLMDARLTQRASLNRGQADALKVVILADERSNSLLVGGSREGFELVQTLAKQLDEAAPALSGRVRLIPMQYADARVVATTMASLFEQRYAAIRTSDVKRTKPIILADTRSNSLLVAANQEDNDTLNELLKHLDAKLDNPALTLTVLPLKHNDCARVATTIEAIFAARMKAQTLPGQTPLPSGQIKLESDALNNALVISASKENLEIIQDLVAKLDQEPVVADGVFETFTLQFADAQRVASILRSLIDQGLYRPGRPAGASTKVGSGRDILSVSVDARSNTLIVSASPENLGIVREVVKRIDNKDMCNTANVRLYPLTKARASTLANTLTQFFQAKRAADSVAINANARLLPVSVIADDRVNSILVTGDTEAFAAVERLLPQLDGESVFARLNFRVFPLKKATARKLQATLQPVFANRPPRVRGEPVDPITIIADQWVNALLVGASVEDMSTVESLIEKMDSAPCDSGSSIHVFPLVKADARQVATTVQGLFRDSQPNQVVPVTIAADERINALVVSCGEDDAQHIGDLVHKLDTEQVSKVSEIRVFPLRYARAESLSTILNNALNTKPPPLNPLSPNAQSVLQFATRSADGKQLITAALKESILITPDPRMNSLIVSGPVDYMGLIEQIITRLDASSPQKAKIKVFTLRNADARQLGQVITQLFRMSPNGNPTGGAAARSIQYTLVRRIADDGPEEDVASADVGTAEENALTITIDPRTNSLLVGGTDHYVELVESVIDSLDNNSARERTTEVIRLKNTQAPGIATAVRTFLDQERQRAIAALGSDAAAAAAAARMLDQEEVAIVAEQTSNTLLLSANQHYFPEIREIVDQLDAAQPQVLIQVLLAEVTLDDTTELGVEWSINGKANGENYTVGTSWGVANALKNFGGFSTAVTGSDFNFLLRALATSGKLEVLSRPQIVTADNMPALVNVGQRVPLVDQSRLDVQNNLTTSYTYQDVGVSLMVTPKISPDGFVKMEVGITNSDISAQKVQINQSSSVPIIDQRRANTTVTAQSGQTIVIGGLISTTDGKTVSKVPWLGDVPLLGVLFRSSTTTRNRKELLILMTPQVLANVQTPVPLQDPAAVTRKILNESILKTQAGDDGDKHRLLDPLFPTNTPPARVLTNTPPSSTTPEPNSKSSRP